MKKNVRMLTGLLALALALTAFAGTALAATTHSFTIVVGESFSKSYENVGTASLTSGSLPPGISWSLSGTTFKLSGKPTKSGVYVATFTTSSSKRTQHGYLIVDVTFKFTVSLKLSELGSGSGLIAPVTIPPENTPTPKPKATPTPGPVTITKHPTDETVEEGGSCQFAAKATSYDKARWHFISPSGEDLNYSDLKKVFTTLEIKGGSGHVMTLSNIPLGMDGYKVYCRYSNGDIMNYAKTDTALLSVYPKGGTPKAQAPTAAPATEVPVTQAPAAVTPQIIYVTPEPTPIVIYVTPEPTPEPTPTAEPVVLPIQGGTNGAGQNGQKKDYTVLYVLAGAAVLVVVMLCVTLIVISRMKAKERARRERERRRREKEKRQREE